MKLVPKMSFLAFATACGFIGGCMPQPLDGSESDDVSTGEDEDVGEAASNLVSGPSYILHAPGGNLAQAFPADYVAYRSWDGTQWCARLYGSTFSHAPGCDWSQAHSGDHIGYKATDGSNWSAKVTAGGFTHAPGGNWAQAHQSAILSYQNWNGEPFHMRLIRTLEHAPGGAGTQSFPQLHMSYLDWSGGQRCASVYGDMFLHAPGCDWSQAHSADHIDYKATDGSNWSAKATANGFSRAPGGDWSQASQSPVLSFKDWSQNGWNIRFPRDPELIAKPDRNFTLNLHGNTHGDGAVVNLWERNGNASQTWTFGEDGRIHPAGDTRFCLAHWGNASDPNNGSGVVLWSCVDHDSQRWAASPDGTIRKLSNPNKCLNLDYNAYENGHVVNVYDCNGQESQQWVPQQVGSHFLPGDQAAGEVGSLFSSYGGDKPPLSFPRGAGTVPDTCDAGYEKDVALCYPSCAPGYDGVGPVCWELCPPGYTDTGALCTYSDGPLLTSLDCHGTFSFPFISCSCPPNYTNTGVACAANTVAKSSYGRGAGSLLSCGANLENDAGLCYTPCPAGYDGVGPVCWLDEIAIDDVASCQDLYNPDLASQARTAGTTVWFGFGTGVTVYQSLSIETGVVYGPDGEFGCYSTTCAGQVTNVSISGWGTFGFSVLGFDEFSGFSEVGQVGTTLVGPAGLSGSPVMDSFGNLVGASASVSLGAGLVPADFGIMECNTSVHRAY